MASSSDGPAPARQFNKLCDLGDFEDPRLRETMRDIVGYEEDVLVHRKYWEWGMLGLYMHDAGLLRPDVDVLAVAAGSEPPLYWLTRHVNSVLATDIYGAGDFSHREATAGMLDDPAAFAPYEYRHDRLQVRSMNALALDLPDESFDVVYSLSSVEHFGDFRAIRRGVREMARVVRPGGHVVITTECFLADHWRDRTSVNTAVRVLSGGRRAPHASPYRRMIDVLTPREIDRYIVRGSGLRLVQPLDMTISSETLATESRPSLTDAGTREFGAELPHVVLRVDSAPWTSVFIALQR